MTHKDTRRSAVYTLGMRTPGWLAPIVLTIVALAVITWLVRRAEPRLAFFPLAGEDATPASFGVEFTASTITTADGERLRVWRLPRPNSLAEVVYFHGNGGNLSLWSDVLVGLWHEGFAVTAVDYRGYGLSTGRPSEAGLYRDVEATLDFVHREPRASAPLIYWGRSLGVAMAAYAATFRPPDGIVLESGFPSMRSVLETNPVLWLLSWVSSYRFPTAEFMSAVRHPTLVLHGDRDEVIPYRLGQRLYAGLPGPKVFQSIAGGRHNDPVPQEAESYWRGVRRFAANLR